MNTNVMNVTNVMNARPNGFIRAGENACPDDAIAKTGDECGNLMNVEMEEKWANV